MQSNENRLSKQIVRRDIWIDYLDYPYPKSKERKKIARKIRRAKEKKEFNFRNFTKTVNYKEQEI